MSNRRFVIWVLLLAMLITLSACAGSIEPGYIMGTDSAEYIEQIKASEEAVRREEEAQQASENGETIPEPTWGTPLPLEVTSYEFDGYGIATGKLEVTLKDARAVTHKDGIPTEGGFYPYDWYLYMGEGWTEEYRKFEEFIQEDGSFAEGVFLILVDITLENHDARNSDSSEKAYGDPYIFQPAWYIKLTEHKYDRKWDFRYSSRYGMDHEEENLAIRLEPGDSVDLTIGFLVGDNWDGSTRDLSKLALGIYDGLDFTVKFPLGLSNYDVDNGGENAS